MDSARITGTALADLLPAQMLEARSQRAADVVILADELVLAAIVDRVDFIAPMAVEEEPFGGRFGGEV